MTEDEMNHREIIIVRRADPDHDDGHHGGVWKIAFADFMTAMMAFFLVMWLINAANEETKKAVASYFTPIKLTDRTSNPKGLNDPKYGKEDPEAEPVEDETTFASGGKLNQKVPDPVTVKEQALFTDPYAVLSEIAGGLVSGLSENGESQKAQNEGAGLGISGGEGFHDPFDPSAWNTELGLARKAEPGGTAEGATRQALQEAAPAPDALVPTPSPRSGAAADAEKEAPAAAPAAKVEDADPAEKARQVAGMLAEMLAGIGAKDGSSGPHVEVKAVGPGVLVSVSDEFQFGMFDIGSSVPTRETVNAMARIGEALSRIEGKVIISGHTDARKFKGKNYDNWRLSTDRAHIAHYMLARGGLDDARIERVEGHADTQPKDADDPLAATNRRIEILVRLP